MCTEKLVFGSLRCVQRVYLSKASAMYGYYCVSHTSLCAGGKVGIFRVLCFTMGKLTNLICLPCPLFFSALRGFTFGIQLKYYSASIFFVFFTF